MQGNQHFIGERSTIYIIKIPIGIDVIKSDLVLRSIQSEGQLNSPPIANTKAERNSSLFSNNVSSSEKTNEDEIAPKSQQCSQQSETTSHIPIRNRCLDKTIGRSDISVGIKSCAGHTSPTGKAKHSIRTNRRKPSSHPKLLDSNNNYLCCKTENSKSSTRLSSFSCSTTLGECTNSSEAKKAITEQTSFSLRESCAFKENNLSSSDNDLGTTRTCSTANTSCSKLLPINSQSSSSDQELFLVQVGLCGNGARGFFKRMDDHNRAWYYASGEIIIPIRKSDSRSEEKSKERVEFSKFDEYPNLIGVIDCDFSPALEPETIESICRSLTGIHFPKEFIVKLLTISWPEGNLGDKGTIINRGNRRNFSTTELCIMTRQEGYQVRNFFNSNFQYRLRVSLDDYRQFHEQILYRNISYHIRLTANYHNTPPSKPKDKHRAYSIEISISAKTLVTLDSNLNVFP